VNRGYIDTKNMFVFGCSGGGVLTSWTVGHTTRFAAAAALCPVIDWISFVGETDGAGWYQNFEKPRLSLRGQLALELIGGDNKVSLEDVIRTKHSYRMLLADRVKKDLVAAVKDSR